MVSKIGPNWFQKLDQILKRNLKYSFNFIYGNLMAKKLHG